MNADKVIECMKAGHTLSNRGTGWWLEAPRKPYTAVQTVQIPDDVVAGLKTAGRIQTEMPYNSIKAILTGKD